MTKQFDFVGRRKVFIGISLAILLVGIVCNFIFGVELDIAFKGGTLLKYSFAGDIDNGAVEQVIKEKLPDASVTISESDLADNTISVELSRRIDLAEQDGLLEALTAAYPDHGIERINVYALEPANGRWFFIKCLVAITDVPWRKGIHSYISVTGFLLFLDGPEKKSRQNSIISLTICCIRMTGIFPQIIPPVFLIHAGMDLRRIRFTGCLERTAITGSQMPQHW